MPYGKSFSPAFLGFLLALAAVGAMIPDRTTANERCVGSIQSMTGTYYKPDPFDHQDGLRDHLQRPGAFGGAQILIVRSDDKSLPNMAVANAKNLMQRDACIGLVSRRSRMSIFNGLLFFGAYGVDNPFDNVAGIYKQTSPYATYGDHNVIWVTLGCIQKNYPDLQSRQEGDVTVITIEDGHGGWPDYGIGLLRNIEERRDLDKLMDWVASADANEEMGNWFWLVPDNSVLRRRVRIDLVDENKNVVASTACDRDACTPKLVIGEVTVKSVDGQRTYSVCGAQAACPQFNAAPDYQILPAQ